MQDFPHEMEIRTDFPRFQEHFTLIIQFKGKGKPADSKTTGKMYVGRYFTVKGEFDEVRDVTAALQCFIWTNITCFSYKYDVIGGIH